jgi:hypothetical protein
MCITRAQRNVIGVSSAFWAEKLQDIKLTVFELCVLLRRSLIHNVIVVKAESPNTVMLHEAVIGLGL